jgi:hypothetical protein
MNSADSSAFGLFARTGCCTARGKSSLEAASFPLHRDQIVELMKKWLSGLEHAAREAQLAGEIRKEADVRQLAFEIQALAMGANWSSRLFRDPNAYRLVRGAILQRIDQATESMPLR